MKTRRETYTITGKKIKEYKKKVKKRRSRYYRTVWSRKRSYKDIVLISKTLDKACKQALKS